MHISTFTRRVPWLATLLLGCADDGVDVPADESTSESTADSSDTAMMPSTSGDSTSGDSITVADDTLADTSTNASTGSNNTAPEANDEVFYTRQDVALMVDAASGGVLGNDSDPDGDPITVGDADAASAQGGVVTVDADGAVAYTPAAGFWGPDTFGYTVSDGTDTASAVVTIYVAPILIPLADVAEGLGGFALDGEGFQHFSGESLDGAGDVDGDGLDDVVVGARGAAPNGQVSGRTYVVFGKADTDPVLFSDITAGTGGFAADGEAALDASGYSVSGAGDVNGDGLADVIIGASGNDPNGAYSGRSYVVFGKDDTDLVELSDIVSGDGGFALDGEAFSDSAGWSVSGADDVNGDGLSDLIVGARGADPNGDGSGRSYVVFGKADTDTVELASIAGGRGGFAVDGEAVGDESGSPVSRAGDVNGDGLADLLVGSRAEGTNGARSGRVYVVFGKADPQNVLLADIAAGTGGFALDGEAAYDYAGRWASSAGDVNGDGFDDVIVGAQYASTDVLNSGRSYVVFGKADTDAVQLSAIVAGTGGFAVDGEGVADGAASVAGAGDVNGDGLADVIVGASLADTNGSNAGRSYVVFGKVDTQRVQLADITAGTGGFALDGETAYDFSGQRVSGAGDVNGDGFADILVAAPQVAGVGVGSGRSYLVFGVPTAPR